MGFLKKKSLILPNGFILLLIKYLDYSWDDEGGKNYSLTKDNHTLHIGFGDKDPDIKDIKLISSMEKLSLDELINKVMKFKPTFKQLPKKGAIIEKPSKNKKNEEE